MDPAIVGPTEGMGERINYSLAKDNRIDYVRKWLPAMLASKQVIKLFKKDLIIDSIVERIVNVKIYYIRLGSQKIDELYYFNADKKTFHGEKVWSRMHYFFDILPQIRVSQTFEHTHWFIGSRNNFTHQLVDFFPNYLMAKNMGQENIRWIIGQENKILDLLQTKGEINNTNTTILIDMPESYNRNGIKIHCSHFKELYLVRHLSIFKAFKLLRKENNRKLNIKSQQDSKVKIRKIGIFAREDNRIHNQREIHKALSDNFNAKIIENISSLSIAERINILKDFTILILPPGSDNINGLCFSSINTQFIQMISCKQRELTSNPYYSYACLRYLLPFLDRTSFWEASKKDNNNLHAGYWEPDDLHSIIQASFEKIW